MTQPRLLNWSAKRAGGSMTIAGTWPDGTAAKLTRITAIEGGAAGPTAVRDNGAKPAERFALA